MQDFDIRWKQRFDNYNKALTKLKEAVSIISRELHYGSEVDELLQEGLIQRFEYTHELAWNVMKDYAEYQGYTDIRGARDAIRKALQIDLVSDRAWMKTIEDRNLSSHNYDNETAVGILNKIITVYYPLFCQFNVNRRIVIEPKLGIDNIFNKVDNRIDSSKTSYALYSPGRMLVAGLKIKI